MKNLMNEFNVDNYVRKGVGIISVKCSNCGQQNKVRITHKHNRQKYTTYTCSACNTINQAGEIYNFDTKKKLNKRLDNRFNSEIYDNYEWSQDYDQI